jgi:hypothetical protein
LAAELHIDRATVIRWEAGDHTPLPYIQPKLARLLGQSQQQLSELIDGRVFGVERAPNISGGIDVASPGSGRKGGSQLAALDMRERRWHGSGNREIGPDVDAACEWLDRHADRSPGSSRRRVVARLDKLNVRELRDRIIRRERVSRTEIVRKLSAYYRDPVPGFGMYHARCAGQDIATTIVTRPGWIDLACPLSPESDRLVLASSTVDDTVTLDDVAASRATRRLVDAVALDVRIANGPLYRLLQVEFGQDAVRGAVSLVPFVQYALTMDLLENELIDLIANQAELTHGSLPIRDRYLPSLESVLDISARLCSGGALALCAIARPADLYRGAPDYVLLVQERSGQVLNAAGRLAVIPKGFHEPLSDFRVDAQIGATLRREMEEELFGRADVDSTIAENRVAAPMHPSRLSEPMRWLVERANPNRMRLECTGFGYNLISGNYEFSGLIVIEDEEFWAEYGGHIEANWESVGLRQYSSRDCELVSDLIADGSWSNEGLFAFLQGIRRLAELGGERVDLPAVEWEVR